jgi:hypothetical protein
MNIGRGKIVEDFWQIFDFFGQGLKKTTDIG